MIAIHYAVQGSTATVVCDVCHLRIDDGSRGVAVFRAGERGERELLSVMHAHNGACYEAAQAKLGGKENTAWEELVNHLRGK